MIPEITGRLVPVFLAFCVGVLAWSTYPWIRTAWFSGFPEAETPVYGASVLLYFFCVSVWHVLFRKKTRTGKTSGERVRSVSPSGERLLSAGMLIAGTALSFAGFHYLGTSPGVKEQLIQLGIPGVSLSPVPVVLFIAFLGAVLLYLSHAPVSRTVWKTPSIILTVTGIVLATFYVGQLSYYDFTHYAGPVHDILMGKPPLTFPSWYGFLSVVFLAFIFRWIPLTLLNLHIVFGVFVVVGFLTFFYASILLFRDYRWAIAAVITGILSNFLVQFGGERNFYPQATFIRFGMWLPVVLAMYWEGRQTDVRRRTVFSWITALVVCLSFYWTADAGLYILGAYLAASWFLSLSSDIREGIRRFVVSVFPALFLITVVYGGTFLWYRIFFGVLPDWSNYWAFAVSFMSLPIFLAPVPPSIIPWAVLGVPVVTLSSALSGAAARGPEKRIVLFLSCLGIISFAYFTGNSHFNGLHHISLPFVLCLMYCIRWWCLRLKKTSTAVRLAGCVVAACVLAVPFYPLTAQAMENYRSKNIITTIDVIRHPRGTEFELFGQTAQGIERSYGEVLRSGDFAIVSPFDTWYMSMWNVTNKLGSNCLLCYWTPEAALPLVIRMKTLSVSYVFVDADETGYEGRVSWIFPEEIKKKYRLLEQIGQLRVYKREK